MLRRRRSTTAPSLFPATRSRGRLSSKRPTPPSWCIRDVRSRWTPTATSKSISGNRHENKRDEGRRLRRQKHGLCAAEEVAYLAQAQAASKKREKHRPDHLRGDPA